MDSEVFELIMDTVSSPYHMSVFYPQYFKNSFKKPMERLTLDVHQIVAGADNALVFMTNYEDMVVELKSNPSIISARIMKKDIELVEFIQEYRIVLNSNKLILIVKPTLNIYADSYLHEELCHISTYTCLNDLIGDVHIKLDIKNKQFDTRTRKKFFKWKYLTKSSLTSSISSPPLLFPLLNI